MATPSNGALPPPKQIRFVNNQGQPPSKRRRVNAACLTCRKRKTRCDGEKPTCSTCDRNGHQCLGYPEQPEKTKPEPILSPVKLEGEGLNDLSDEPEDAHMENATDGHDHTRRHSKTPFRANQQPQNANEGGDRRGDRRDSSTSSAATATRPGRDSNEWDMDPSSSQVPGRSGKRLSLQRTVSFSEDGRSSSNRSPVQHHRESHRVPYFRYFGPTAIVPGYKQMVVNVHHYHRRQSRGGSMSAASPGSMLSYHSSLPSLAETVLDAPDDIPVYDPNDSVPVHPITISLIKTFFLHLGCSYPFLHEEKTLRLVKEKRLDAILVDAMCALAARFSNIDALATDGEGSKSDLGNAFAQRARAATVDTFPCPTVGAVQALLLMAYEGFGANQDSTLWMYLGLAIRMAFDLGLQRNEGVQYQGDKDPWYTRSWNHTTGDEEDANTVTGDGEPLNPEEQQEIVQERIDTAWAVYVLDRIISSGTGRPVTVRDEEFELPIPEAIIDPASGWPLPYPAFIQIIQFYGRVSDVLNKIKRVEDLTEEKMSILAKIEHDLTKLYHKQDPQLHFNPLHFQNFVKNGQGTTFILLHVWFHALIILLHQPLLTYFGSREPQLTPHSRELAMSSAKTIADILALAELIDPKSYIGNPFTSQPIYIAACAFLTESAAIVSQPVSRNTSPPMANGSTNAKSSRPVHGKTASGAEAKPSKHSLLADAANQNYQRCYKSLQQLNMYWGGVNYILVVLDHRSKGIWDCETYTAEEYESTRLPRRPASLSRFAGLDNPSSPQPSIPPIAWSLTGTTNSPNSSLTLLYQNMNAGSQPSQIPPPPPAPAPVSAPTPPGNMIYDPIRQSLPESTSAFSPSFPQPNVSGIRYSANNPNRIASSLPTNLAPGNRSGLTPEVGPGTPGSESRLQVLSGLASGNHVLPPLSAPFTPSSNYEPSLLPGVSPTSSLTDPSTSSQQQHRTSHLNAPTANHSSSAEMISSYAHDFAPNGLASGSYSYLGNACGPITDAITVEEISIGSLGLPNDMMPPWDFFPADFPGLFDAHNLGEGNHGHM
ncbi:Nitrogen assimilation transcription factor nit-4 [Cytospora mali]|uniref:Nitrogen assimilation transcription factor nit-4 n=1 Tax=Cytospora mali TaxID=578113 RepID=A0A194V6B9_CYTMA|nr:Nitrogen assimilation transcription factor nit-4 [Valsa mali var. pyri (nom. inval.)]